MAKFCLIVFSTPKPGMEDEYNAWYNDRHLDDVLKVPGFVAAQRFKVDANAGFPGRYVALYEMEADDPEAVMAELMRRAGTDAMVMTEAMDVAQVSMALCPAVSARVLSP